MNEVRIQAGSSRSAVAADHLWRWATGDAPPALLDTLPVADHYLVIVPPERVCLYRLALPAGPRRAALAALPFQLEERLIEPLDHYEIVVVEATGADPAPQDRRVCLAVFERDWLTCVQAALKPIASGEVRWVLAGWAWPDQPGTGECWQVRVESGRALLHRQGAEIVALAAGDLEAGLSMALHDPDGGRPRLLRIDPGPGSEAAATLERIGAWAAGHGIAVERVALPDPWRADYPACPWSLLRQRRSGVRQAAGQLLGRAPWRRLLWVGALLVTIEVLASLAYWGQLSWQTGRAQHQAGEMFRAVAGPSAAVVDPLLQMQRLYRSRRHQAGLSAADDFLPLLAAVSANLPAGIGQVVEIGYEAGRLRLVWPLTEPAPGAAAMPPLAAQVAGPLRAAGWQATTNLSPDRRRLTVVVSP